MSVKTSSDSLDYVIRVHASPLEVMPPRGTPCSPSKASPAPSCGTSIWRRMHESGSASPETGWTPRFITLWQGDALCGACPLYLKDHSYGEFVFDHSLGQRLPAARPALLPQSPHRPALHPRARLAAAGAGCGIAANPAQSGDCVV